MSRLFSPDYRPPASYNPMQSSRSKTGSGVDEEKPLPPRFNPRTKLYDREGNLTGRQIGAGSKEIRRRDQHGGGAAGNGRQRSLQQRRLHRA